MVRPPPPLPLNSLELNFPLSYSVFINWGRQVRAAGIEIPIVPGIMPIQTYAAFKRRTDFSKTIVPQALWDLLEPIKDDDKAVRELGTKFVADMCRKILAAGLGIHGIHCCASLFLFWAV